MKAPEKAPEPLLLDTHIWFWLVTGHERLARNSVLLKAIEKAADRGRLWLSAISVWEIAMLEAKGRIELGRRCESWMDEALKESRIRLAPLDPNIAILSTRLEGFSYADPADRMIAATAIDNGWRLVTADQRLGGYLAEKKIGVWEV